MDKGVLPKDIVDDVVKVLAKGSKRRDGIGVFYTAHQIFNRLDPAIREALRKKHRDPGMQKLKRRHYGPLHVIEKAAKLCPEKIEIERWLSTDDVVTAGAKPGSGVCAIYRLKRL